MALTADEELSIWARHLTVRQQPARVLSDADGRFELTGLSPHARYTLRAQQPYDNATVVHGIEEGNDVRIVLPASGSISGVVRDVDGRPVAHAHISAQQPVEIAPGQALTGQSIVFPPAPGRHGTPSGMAAPGSPQNPG